MDFLSCFVRLFVIVFVCGIFEQASTMRLIRERGFREETFFYHLGNGGYTYHFNMETATSIYFKCATYSKTRCCGRAVLYVGGEFRETKPHSHPPDPDFVGMRHFRQNVLNAVENNPRYVSYEDIVNEARRDRRYTRRCRRMMTLSRLRTPMYVARMKTFPPIPHTLLDLTRALLQHPRVSVTVDGDENLYAGSITAADGSHHVLFLSPRMNDFLRKVKTLQGDGTFKARPAVPHSCQVFVLVTTYKSCVIPLAWALMERRTIAAYRAVFHLLKQVFPRLNPNVIISDWEYPQQRAWNLAFPNARIQGCMWHLSRAFIKKANKLGVMRYRFEIPAIMEYIMRACAIALLPDQLMEQGLDILRARAQAEDFVVAFLLWPFFLYVQESWLNNPTRRAWMTFWGCTFRTNNSCECHNRQLRKAVGAYQPNVWCFIMALAQLEHNANLDVPLMVAGENAKRPRRWQSIYADKKMEALAEDLEDDIFNDMEETIWNFLGQGANLLKGAFDDHVAREVPEE